MEDYFGSKYYEAHELESECSSLVKRNMPAEYVYPSNIYEGFKKLYDEFREKLLVPALCFQESGEDKYRAEMIDLAREYAFKMAVRKDVMAYGLSENPWIGVTNEHMIESACKKLDFEYVPNEKDKETLRKELISEFSMDERKQALWGLCKVYIIKAAKNLEKVHVCCNVNWQTAAEFYEHELKPADIKINVKDQVEIIYLKDLVIEILNKYIDTDYNVQVSTKQMLKKAHEHVAIYINTNAVDMVRQIIDIAFKGVQQLPS